MRSVWLQNAYYRGTPADRLRSLQVLWDGSGDVLPITPWIGVETGASECRGFLVHEWGILYLMGAVIDLLARPFGQCSSVEFGFWWPLAYP